MGAISPVANNEGYVRISGKPDLMDRTRFVEFVGLPGVGKSTVARELVALLRARNCVVVASTDLTREDATFLLRTFYRLKLIASASPSTIPLYCRIAANVIAQGQHTLLDLMKVIYNFWTVVAMLTTYRRHNRGLVIVDQGIAQAIWSVHLTATKTKRLEGWNLVAKAIGLHDIRFVVLQADTDLVKARLGQRCETTSRMQSASRSDCSWHEAETIRRRLVIAMQEWLETDKELYETKTDRLIVLRTDDQNKPAELAAEIEKFFLLAEHPEPTHV
jgi:2-phosphoglycerate kinase